MHQAHLGQDLYPTSLAGAFELMVRLSMWYKSLGKRQGQRSGRGGHNGGRGNGDCGNNPRNRRVIFLQQGRLIGLLLLLLAEILLMQSDIIVM